MKTYIKKSFRMLRRIFSKSSSLLLLFQRSPIVQMLLPEAHVLGTAHVMNATALTITTVVGLGAYDSVSGATAVAQVAPTPGASSVSATSGTNLNFVVQITGAGGHTPASWTVVGTLPPGLVHTNAKNSKTDSITGKPTQSGSFPISIKAWENSNNSGRSATGSFTINVAPAAGIVITSQPSSITIASGSSTTLSIVAGGSSNYHYQWYEGAAGTTTKPVGTDSSSFTTPVLTTSSSYWVKVTSTAFPAGTNSNTAQVTVAQPANIVSQPQSKSILTGTSTSLSVTASGTGPIAYQWYRGVSGDTTVPVGTNATTFITPVLTTNTSYWVKVSNAVNPTGAASNTATVTVNRPASIVTPPRSTVIAVGNSATLQVVAAGTEPITYQWYQGIVGDKSVPLANDSATLVTPPLKSNTSYWVSISNPWNVTPINSAAALVTVNQPAQIVAQPASLRLVSAKTAALKVVASGTGPFVYQWYLGESGDTSMPVGKNASTFTTPALKTDVNYWVKVSSITTPQGVFSETSRIVVLNPVVFTTQPQSKTIATGDSITLTAAVTGTGPFHYQWYEGNVGVVTKPVGEDLDTFVTPPLSSSTIYWVKVTSEASPLGMKSLPAKITVQIPAAIVSATTPVYVKTGSSAKLKVVASGTAKLIYQWYQGESGDTSLPVGKSSSSFTTPKLIANANYWVRVSNAIHPTGVNSATMSVVAGAPAAIVTQPQSTAVESGQSAQLSVVASGVEPMSYQWYQGPLGTVTMPVGENSPNFTTSPLSASTSYWVKVSNPLLPKGVRSVLAAVTVTAPAVLPAAIPAVPSLAPYEDWARTQFDSTLWTDDTVFPAQADPDADGESNHNERIMGTNPLVADGSLLAVTSTADTVDLSFVARSTAGGIDEKATRHYVIESSANLEEGVWKKLPGYEDVVASGQTVSVTLGHDPEQKWFRIRAWLVP
jgi:hypothetical protein